ncbi:MAG: acyltransferase [Candidatus ainarchaeum sp.]|nr:acyltransferase [Candidatus ainarchaeum sp.]
MRNLKTIKCEKGKSSTAWQKIKPTSKVIKNWILAVIASKFQSNTKIWFYKKIGLKIGKNVQIMPDQRIDIFFPELISVGDNSIIGQDCFFACHEFNVDEFKYGPIEIGENVLIGARCYILPGIKVGNNSLVGAGAVISKDVPENVIAFGNPIQFIDKTTKEKILLKSEKKK